MRDFLSPDPDVLTVLSRLNDSRVKPIMCKRLQDEETRAVMFIKHQNRCEEKANGRSYKDAKNPTVFTANEAGEAKREDATGSLKS